SLGYFQGLSESKHAPSSEASPTIEPTATPIPASDSNIERVQQPYQDADPIMACQNAKCRSINIRRSQCVSTGGYVCCQICSTYTWSPSSASCTQAQTSQVNTP